MVTPLSLIPRAARAAQLPIGRCPVCHEQIYDPAVMLTLRGGIHMHRSCATYRTRQRARAL